MVEYLGRAYRTSARITKVGNKFSKIFDFKDIKIIFKVRDTHKIEKQNFSGISVFGYENKENKYISKNIQSMCHKNVVKLLTWGEGKRHYLVIKGFNTFMYHYTLNHGKQHFYP